MTEPSHPHYRPAARGLVHEILALAAGLVVFAAVFWTEAGAGIGGSQVIVPLVLGGCLALAALAAIPAPVHEPAPWGACAATIIAFILAGLALSGKWQSAVSTDILIGGLLPFSDNHGYFNGALFFLHDGRLTDWTTRRPFTALQLSSMLALSGGSLRLATAMLTALATAAGAGVIIALHRSLGRSAAIAAGAVLFVFFYPTIGSVMSENPGFTLGCCAFVLMWTGTSGARPVLFSLGLFLLGLALAARAGAMFVLPVLVLWAGWRFREPGARYSWTWAAIAAVASGAALGLSMLAGTVYGTVEGQGYSNFAHTLYGLASGGQQWDSIYRAYPHLKDMRETEEAAEAYRLAIAQIKAHPLDLVVGVAHRYNDFFINVRWLRFIDNGGLRAVVALFLLAGLYRAFRSRKAPVESLVLWVTVGVWLSVPFIGDGGSRVRAATVPFTAALVALGIHTILGRFGRAPAGTAAHMPGVPIALIAAGLTCAGFLGLARGNGPSASADASLACSGTPPASSQELLAVPGGWIDIVPNGSPRTGEPGVIAIDTLRQGIMWPYPATRLAAETAPPFRIAAVTAADRDIRRENVPSLLFMPPGSPVPGHFMACFEKRENGVRLLRGPILQVEPRP